MVLTLYHARVDPHLTYGCEVVLDVSPSSVAELQAVQHTILRRMLSLGPRSQLAPLFSETGCWPVRYRRLQLAFRYAQYLVRDRPPLAFAALHEAAALAEVGAMSWCSDLYHALQALSAPVNCVRPSPTSLAVWLDNLAAALPSSLAWSISDSLLHSDRLPILQWCIHTVSQTLPPGGGLPLAHVLKWHQYLSIPNNSHRHALIHLLVSDHGLAIESLRRVQPPVPRYRRVCCFCRGRSAVETECHVFWDCRDVHLCTLRIGFWDDASRVVGVNVVNYLRGLPALEKFRHLLDYESLLPRFALLVYDLFQLVDSVPILHQ